MPKICVQSPEVVMSGGINIHAQFAIVTKAKLDSIAVRGNCECGDAPPVITDYVIVIDGSDSFNNKGKFSKNKIFLTNKILTKVLLFLQHFG